MEDEDSSLSSFDTTIDNLAVGPFSSLFRDLPEGNIPESISAPSSVSNTAPTPKPIQPDEGKHTPPAANDKRPPTNTRKEESLANGKSIKCLIEETGYQHVYFGRGKPITTNPGNKRFRSIVDKYCWEYKRANYSRKGEIMKMIVEEVKSNGSNFFVVQETKGNARQEPADVKKVLAKTGHALRDAWKYRAHLWIWADPAQGQLSWTNYSNKDGTALEKMFQEDSHRREEVPVSIRKEKHLVDVSSMMMHRVDTNGSKNFTYLQVRRLKPEEEMDRRELIWVSEDSDDQFAASSSAESSGSQSSGASGATINSSLFHPAVGAGGVQSNLYTYCNLCTAQQSNDECAVLAFEALEEDIFEETTAAL
jgi:hypothetical protein